MPLRARETVGRLLSAAGIVTSGASIVHGEQIGLEAMEAATERLVEVRRSSRTRGRAGAAVGCWRQSLDPRWCARPLGAAPPTNVAVPPRVQLDSNEAPPTPPPPASVPATQPHVRLTKAPRARPAPSAHQPPRQHNKVDAVELHPTPEAKRPKIEVKFF